ncbi:fimbrial protein [Enterobacter sp. CC120223-11]|uniref:fimbrial protein n=1 Tax=Enterobacter sp. CC120223-11 TaxID=1378073 RepID=UPI000BDC05BE|nr:fimbrial protein [Enterobacter sp. CC120223-11]SNY75351.1 Pilin (type 1 fimbria component protein) [Enterobacter sp. CC120223-11]
MRCIIRVVLTILQMITIFSASAADEQMLSITLNVIKPPCILNGGQNINVNFGDEVFTTRIDGVYKKQKIEYKPTNCLTSKFKLRIEGNPAAWDSKLLASNNEGLGIRFLNSGTELALYSWINFSSSKWPVLEAALVKNDKKVLKSGPFTAGATLMIEYQ